MSTGRLNEEKHNIEWGEVLPSAAPRRAQFIDVQSEADLNVHR